MNPPLVTRPNLIFFFTDQQRWDSTGLHGNPLDLTPNLDRIARANTHLSHCFTPQPVCGPARACLQTGMYASSHGCISNGVPLPDNLPLLANSFREGGYETAYIGKWHLAGRQNPRGPVPVEKRGGYEYWLGAEAIELVTEPYRCNVYNQENQEVILPGYRVDALTDAAIRYVSTPKEKPFFLFFSLLEPHHQNNTDDYPAPTGYADRYQGRWTPPDLQALGGTSPQHLGGYWGMVRRIDEAYGRLMDSLQSLNLLEKTVVVFTSDHGCHFKTRNSEYKRSCHDASLRVPGVISGPGFSGGGQIDKLISLVDLPPTLLEAAGLKVPETMQGRSLLPLLRGNAAPWPEEVFFQISEASLGRGIRTRRWKYAVTAPAHINTRDRDSSLYLETELYDLNSDPYELTNLIDKSGMEPILSPLRETLLKRMREIGEPEAVIQTRVK